MHNPLQDALIKAFSDPAVKAQIDALPEPSTAPQNLAILPFLPFIIQFLPAILKAFGVVLPPELLALITKLLGNLGTSNP